MSGSPSLNPASTPFFPGGGGLIKEDDGRNPGVGLHCHIGREQYNTSTSSLPISPTEYRSVKSSPSPQHESDGLDRRPHVRQYQSQVEASHQSPYVNQIEAERGFPIMQRVSVKGSSMSAIVEGPPDSEDISGPTTATNGSYQHMSFYASMASHVRDRLNTPPVALDITSRTPSFNSGPTHFMSSSPSSFSDSGSLFTPSVDLPTNFESQLKASPLINEMLDRLARYEYASREIHRDLTDFRGKFDLLVERTINANANIAPPEFRDPFASPTPSFSMPGFHNVNGPRSSIIGNIAPNQAAPPDDISVISHRLNSLSTPVDQLLALSTHQAQVGGSLQPTSVLRQSPQPNDLLGRRTMAPPNTVNLGHGLPIGADIRTTPRIPGPPMRTWSAGTLDLPIPTGSIGRADSGLRNKRRSVTGLLRRGSAVADAFATSSRESGLGPVISKWEQLTLAPELLRSLNQFGVGPPNKIQQRALPFLLRGSNIIAQAPPTQERIAAYVIPAIHIALVNATNHGVSLRGPLVVMIFTTVDQATQAQRMIRDLGGPIGVRSALGIGATSAGTDLSQELRLLHQNMPHIICGTPQKLHALFTSSGGIFGSEVRFLVLDEVDQLIARNLHDFVFNIVKLLPPPCSRSVGTNTPTQNSGGASPLFYTLFDGNASSSSLNAVNAGRRFSTAPSSSPEVANANSPVVERQTALFSNIVPQDVLNFASAIQLREPVRVLVRRDGNVTQADTSQGARGLRQFYLYLAFTAGGGRSDSFLQPGNLGIIGSGRSASSAETAQARGWKLEALTDLFDDVDVSQAIIHVGGLTALESVAYKLSSRGLEAVPLHGDLNASTKLAALNKFRSPTPGMMRQSSTRVLVVYDVFFKTPEVPWVPLVINYARSPYEPT
ncbi:hypothetical protein PHLCEN_2v781 [Hermanssonia centrifuga]|uniref:Helicase ATP-binding domain-containing protein n=1 Tax=Hermanssonia centrifuga TaxID=98765 RepID=A0A1U7KK60_9APHY|nr:hypothetical protein PHLCEN_2v781 [Hermanssonia centrifuga]